MYDTHHHTDNRHVHRSSSELPSMNGLPDRLGCKGNASWFGPLSFGLRTVAVLRDGTISKPIQGQLLITTAFAYHRMRPPCLNVRCCVEICMRLLSKHVELVVARYITAPPPPLVQTYSALERERGLFRCTYGAMMQNSGHLVSRRGLSTVFAKKPGCCCRYWALHGLLQTVTYVKHTDNWLSSFTLIR